MALVKFETTEESVKPLFGKGTMSCVKVRCACEPGPTKPVCQPGVTIARPLSETIEARATGGFDSAHLKPGKEIWVRVISGYVYPAAHSDLDAILYGHVRPASTLKNSSESELSLVFDSRRLHRPRKETAHAAADWPGGSSRRNPGDCSRDSC